MTDEYEFHRLAYFCFTEHVDKLYGDLEVNRAGIIRRISTKEILLNLSPTNSEAVEFVFPDMQVEEEWRVITHPQAGPYFGYEISPRGAIRDPIWHDIRRTRDAKDAHIQTLIYAAFPELKDKE
ncbi:hypothetical protein PP914_gp072 [Arthrobacter phage Qui]|jgi:hypothetical protein|uniref:Uncharacterized protein n=1 Tax=Arthrobacter phage Qui TaxID=2603260 RepID=A0A5B8WLT5_9CAUD|nr:hypothetical protein PP914_gp072 [Arthrobacter phage Qui]QED11562.1 hypothetical protein SEA_QUI_72 [Arthrobacter phage Qui]QOC56394.1 hypothetical protein SEA_PAELLA_72 [Arthrobacter phage Paella]